LLHIQLTQETLLFAHRLHINLLHSVYDNWYKSLSHFGFQFFLSGGEKGAGGAVFRP
jgi:hypothetical protein